MKAIINSAFGGVENLKVADIAKPIPKDNEVLIKIHSSTVTSTDCNVRNMTFVMGILKPIAKLFFFGVLKPRIKILGFDIAGEIESIGKKVTKYKVGDKVFGADDLKFGGHAQYKCLKETDPISIKPDSLTWEQVATLPLAGTTALFFVRDLGKISRGQKVLIMGASGAIGTFAVQLAKYYGAEVTGVCSTPNVDMVKSIGADQVIDYTKEDYCNSDRSYDVIFDFTHLPNYQKIKNILKPEGSYLCVNSGISIMLQSLSASFAKQKVKTGMARCNTEDLNYLRKLIEAGLLKPVIDRTYSLDDIQEAFKYAEQGHKKGSVIITT